MRTVIGQFLKKIKDQSSLSQLNFRNNQRDIEAAAIKGNDILKHGVSKALKRKSNESVTSGQCYSAQNKKSPNKQKMYKKIIDVSNNSTDIK